MIIRVEIETGNAAFEGEDLYLEVGRILGIAGAKVINSQKFDHQLHDYNGNNVGQVQAIEEPFDD